MCHTPFRVSLLHTQLSSLLHLQRRLIVHKPSVPELFIFPNNHHYPISSWPQESGLHELSWQLPASLWSKQEFTWVQQLCDSRKCWVYMVELSCAGAGMLWMHALKLHSTVRAATYSLCLPEGKLCDLPLRKLSFTYSEVPHESGRTLKHMPKDICLLFVSDKIKCQFFRICKWTPAMLLQKLLIFQN